MASLLRATNRVAFRRVAIAQAPRRGYASQADASLKKTALYDLHVKYGGKMVPFAGHSMPLVYKDLGTFDSHKHTRAKASLFDVSHMGQLQCVGAHRASFMESVTVADVKQMEEDTATLSLITNEEGGIVDDTIVTKRKDSVAFVVNGACYEKDMKWLGERLALFHKDGGDASLVEITDRALVAVQGPLAEEILQPHIKEDISDMKFMTCKDVTLCGHVCFVQRSGYTGEDGFELSIPNSHAQEIVEKLMENENLKLSGLGARDTLRLEAGLCLYGNDIDATTSPKESNLLWTIPKSRRERGGFPGDTRIQAELNKEKKITRKRIGLVLEGRRPCRAGAKILDPGTDYELGKVTSGSFAPSLEKNIAMGYIRPRFGRIGSKVEVDIRGNRSLAHVVRMPFVPSNYKK